MKKKTNLDTEILKFASKIVIPVIIILVVALIIDVRKLI